MTAGVIRQTPAPPPPHPPPSPHPIPSGIQAKKNQCLCREEPSGGAAATRPTPATFPQEAECQPSRDWRHREECQEKGREEMAEEKVTEKSDLPLLQTAPHLNMAVTDTERATAFQKPELLTQLSVVGRSGMEM